jgi:hypothetical protein
LYEAARYDAALLTDTPHMVYATKVLPYLLGIPRLQYVYGHFGFDPCFHDVFGSTWKFITLLRDPVVRWFSHYFYDRYKTHSDRFTVDTDLATYLETNRAVSKSSESSCDELDTAKKVLERFHIVGITEDMSALESRFSESFAVSLNIGFERVNPLPKEQQAELIEDWMIERVRDLCRRDIEIYKYARTLNRSGRPVELC